MNTKIALSIASMLVLGLVLVGTPATAKGEKCAEYHFVYTDGHEDKGVFCDGNDIKSGLHVNTLHVSCSDKIEDGKAKKSDLDGHLIEAWQIIKTKDGKEDKRCGPGVPDEPPRDNCEDLNLQAIALSDGNILLTFNSVLDGVNIYRAANGGPFSLVAELDEFDTSYMDTDTVPGTTYTYIAAPTLDGQPVERCPPVQVTAVPVFGTGLAAGLAGIAGLAGYAGLRRRQ